ncbi:MAG: pitrilysin family protein [Pseudomonadota bacterium]
MTFNSSKLNNGLNIVTYSMPYVNSVSINIIVKVGSRYESEEEAGISHFLEHMAFKGTKTRSAIEIAKEFDSIGGHFNAYTSRENTVYYTKVLKQHTKQAIGILADILQNSLFEEEDIKKELSVISQEIAGVKDCPDDLVFENFYELAYNGHPLGRSILGTYDNIAKFDKNSFQDYINKHYCAENIYISIAGNIDHNESVSIAQDLFSSFPTKSSRKQEKSRYSGGFKITEKSLEQTTIALGFESVSYQNLEDFYHAQILSIILGGGLSSRLFQTIREKHGLAYGIGSGVNAFCDSGIFSIYAAADHRNVQIMIDKIIEEIGKIRENISQEELDRAKAQIESNIYMAEEKTEYKSEEVGKNFALFGKYFPAKQVMDIISATQINDLKSSANKIFNTSPTLATVGDKLDNFNFNNMCDNLLK